MTNTSDHDERQTMKITTDELANLLESRGVEERRRAVHDAAARATAHDLETSVLKQEIELLNEKLGVYLEHDIMSTGLANVLGIEPDRTLTADQEWPVLLERVAKLKAIERLYNEERRAGTEAADAYREEIERVRSLYNDKSREWSDRVDVLMSRLGIMCDDGITLESRWDIALERVKELVAIDRRAWETKAAPYNNGTMSGGAGDEISLNDAMREAKILPLPDIDWGDVDNVRQWVARGLPVDGQELLKAMNERAETWIFGTEVGAWNAALEHVKAHGLVVLNRYVRTPPAAGNPGRALSKVKIDRFYPTTGSVNGGWRVRFEAV